MKKISSEKIEDGMVLLMDVCGPTGNVLVSKGTPLTAAIGRRLINFGISFIFIEGEEENGTIVDAPGFSPEDMKSRLEKKFSGCINEPFMKKIFDAACQFHLKSKNE